MKRVNFLVSPEVLRAPKASATSVTCKAFAVPTILFFRPRFLPDRFAETHEVGSSMWTRCIFNVQTGILLSVRGCVKVNGIAISIGTLWVCTPDWD